MSGESARDLLVERLIDALDIDSSSEMGRLVTATLTGSAEKGHQPAEEGNVSDLSTRSPVDLASWQYEAERAERINEALMAQLEMIACALGSCPTCWGEDPDCPDCEGIGKPGAFAPDPHCFQQYVAPVIRAVYNERNRRSRQQKFLKTPEANASSTSHDTNTVPLRSTQRRK